VWHQTENTHVCLQNRCGSNCETWNNDDFKVKENNDQSDDSTYECALVTRLVNIIRCRENLLST